MIQRSNAIAGRTLTAALGLAMVWTLAGCSAYQLQGKAINGPRPAVLVVNADDPRLDQPGLMGVVVQVTLDPRRLSAKEIGGDVADTEGQFTVPVDEFGAGLLEYDVQIAARLKGHRPTIQTLRLPGANQRLLVVMTPGRDTGAPVSEDVLDETLRLGEPYMGR